MRTLKTSLFVLAMTAPTAAFAQEAAPPAPDQLADEPAAEPSAPTEAAPAAEPVADVPAATAAASVSTTTATADAAPALGARPVASRSQRGPESGQSWEFGYHGYFRAPMRLGIGKRDQVVDADGNEIFDNRTTFHSPVIPDDQYLSWQSTGHNKRDWAEMYFSVGNGTVSGNLAIQGFQFTDATWADRTAQFGISQGWVEINTDAGYENVKLNAKAGSFWSRYGAAGRYDAGEYDTYLFGRTHAIGATTRADFDLGGQVLGAEIGYGVHRPDPNMFNRARFTNLAHAHLFYTLDEIEFSAHLLHSWAAQEVVPHYPTVLPDSNCQGAQAAPSTPVMACSTGPTTGGVDGADGVFGTEYPNGTLTVAGIDGRFDLGMAGYLYAGYAHVQAKNSLVVSSAIETIHAFGGGEFNLGITDAYLESPFCPDNAPNDSCSNGTGSVDTLLAQYEIGLANFDVFEGNQDLRFKLYGMLNFVSVDDREDRFLQPLADSAGVSLDDLKQDGVRRTKFGLDAEFLATSWLAAGVRADRLQPNQKVPEQSFSIISPRITFRSDFVTREQISLQYSRYIYNERECRNDAGGFVSPADNPFRSGTTYNGSLDGLPARVFCVQPPPSAVTPDGFGATTDNQPTGNRGGSTLRPDVNVFKIEASMWW